MVVDVQSGCLDNIPSLKSSDNSTPAACPCGIHSIAVNPSKTLLATGAENTNDLAVYKLPTFDPVCVGEVNLRGCSLTKYCLGDWIHFEGRQLSNLVFFFFFFFLLSEKNSALR